MPCFPMIYPIFFTQQFEAPHRYGTLWRCVGNSEACARPRAGLQGRPGPHDGSMVLLWCAMDPINKNPSHVSINIPAPWILWAIHCFRYFGDASQTLLKSHGTRLVKLVKGKFR